MCRFRFLIAASALVVCSFVSKADTLNGAGSWQSWTAATLATSGGPYWNNNSGDGAQYNVGWCLNGGGSCSMSNPPGTLPYFGNGTASVSNMWFSTGGSAVTVTLAGVFTTQTDAALHGIDYFGYYLADSTGAPIAGTSHQLFSTGQPLSSSATFTVAANTSYGFYIENVQGQGGPFETDYWSYMDDTADGNSRGNAFPNFQHFAAFDSTTSLYLGMEDSTYSSDMDYNDVIVNISAAAIPEPVPTALAGIGLVAFGLMLYRKRSRVR